jgi:metal-sulfur cluster biosynthetic enzyme
MTTEDLLQRIKDALRLVIDPELGYNIVDLGLVYEVKVDSSGTAYVRMTTTTRGCPATAYLQDGARDAVSAVPDVNSVEVDLTYDPPWVPDMMTANAKQHLGIAGDGW